MRVARAAAAKLQQVRGELSKRRANRDKLSAVAQVLHELAYPVGEGVGDSAKK